MVQPIDRAILFGFFLLLITEAGRADSLKLALSPARPLPKHLYSFNCNLLTATALEGISFSSLEFEWAIQDLRPQGLRFPGGTTANNYRWQEDTFSEQKNDLTGWAAGQIKLFRKIGRPYDLPGYVGVCRQFDLAPIWVLNIYEETPESVTSLFTHLDGLGLDLKAIERSLRWFCSPAFDSNFIMDTTGEG